MSNRDIEDIYPLSPMQQGMLFHSLYEPGSGVYVEQVSCSLVGPLNSKALVQAWKEVVKRHTILRTGFIWEDLDEPLQIVFRDAELPVYQEDWRDLDQAAQKKKFEALRQEDVRTGFDLSVAPLMRLYLIRIQDEIHDLIWTHHHLLLDGWSMPLLLKEVFLLYEAFNNPEQMAVIAQMLGANKAIADVTGLQLRPSRPYRDYIAWLKKQDLTKAEEYWRTYLRNFQTPTKLNVLAIEPNQVGESLPASELVAQQEEDPSTQKTHITIRSIRFSPSTSKDLRMQAQEYGITLNTWFQGAWGLLLSRYCREKEVLFGATVSGRPAELPGVDTMLGLFINTLPVRAAVDSQTNIVDWLKSLQNQQAAGRQYEYTPLVQAHAWSEIPSNESMFDSILVFENYPVESSMNEQRGSIQITNLRHYGKTNYPFTVVVAPGPEIEIQIVFDNLIYQEAAVQRLLSHLGQIVENMVENPMQPLASVKMLSPQEEEMVLVNWNLENDKEFNDTSEIKTIHQLFQKQATQTPDQTALIALLPDGGIEALTYQELNERANKLAQYLVQKGLGKEFLAGVCLERSQEMVVGLFGVLMAGGAYVPLDPSYPSERLSYMVQDSKIRILLTQSKLLPKLESDLGDSFSNLEVICLDTDREILEQNNRLEEFSRRSDDNPDQAAYVIYTSGSTGEPKGVVVNHRSLVNHARSMAEIMELQAGTRLAQLISLSFDAAGEEIYPLITSGGTLVLPEAGFELSGLNILRFCEKFRINVLHLAVPVWHSCVDELQAHHLVMPESFQVVLVGGESPLPERLKIWSQFATKPIQFINAYGPTEATITATVFKKSVGGSSDWPLEITKIPIGRPIPNTRLFLLDQNMQPTPIGVPGEIYIGGSGLARGYLDRPELTGEKFVPNPFRNLFPNPEQEESRLYRTGDLGVFLPDGNIEFLGRVDYQVKLRGYRIELEEIESVLRQFSQIKDCAVLLQEDSAENKQIIAYVVLKTPDEHLGISDPSQNEALIEPKNILKEIRSGLRDNLPDYMIPSGFVTVAELPRMPNGKVDRKALLQLNLHEGAVLFGEGSEYIAPRDAIEEIIAGLWQEVLGVDSPGVYDNFLELGGHSLKATQLLSRVRQAFQAEISLRSLFEAPTVASMAASVREAVHGQKPLKPLPVLPRDEHTGVPLTPPPVSFSQQRLWFLDQLDPGNLAHNIPAVVRIKGALDVSALEKSLNGVIQRHESLRSTFEAVDGKPVQIIKPELEIPIPLIDLSSLLESEKPSSFDNWENSASSQQSEIVVEKWIFAEIRQPFDLAVGPLIRAAILRLDPSEYVLVVTIHHIVSDGWSMGILVREVASLYAGWYYSDAPKLPELQSQFADYAAWQREWLSGDELDRQLSYWKNKLAGMPPLLDLPTDRPRPALKTSNGALADFVLAKDLSEAIQALARQEGVTVYMLLLAAFQTLLYRYSGQEDINVGSAIANRTLPEVEGMIGFFVNTLVLRTDLSGKPSFRDLLQQVREVALEAYAHQDLPFEMLVEALQPERNLSYTPLFQVGFDLQEVPVKGIELPDLSITPVSAHAGSAAFDLLMSINQSPGYLSGSLEFNTDLFDRSTVERMLAHFENLLRSIIEDIEQSVVDLAMLSKDELRQILIEWNASESRFPDDRCIHQLFEDQVDKASDTVALTYNGQSQMTYGELNRRANIFAHYLIKKGVGKDTLVGISTDRSFEMIVGILGILKAGGAYLPLDPNYPIDRLAFMLQDSQISILVSQKRVVDRLANLFEMMEEKTSQLEVLPIDAIWQEIETTVSNTYGSTGGENPTTDLKPENLAYIIYTSGSTGKPKGTLLRHKGLCNLVTWQKTAFEISGQSKVLQFSPFSFDASVWETFMALANGATLCLAEQDILANGLELVRLIKEQQVTTVTLPPSLLSVLPEELVRFDALPSLKTVIAAGEACSKEIVQRWAPGRQFFNAYGPTEITVCASAARVHFDLDQDLGLVSDPPIGRPIANTQLYVVDQYLKPTAVGVPGELLIGGVSVAVGYHHRPELTAEKFIPNPMAAHLRSHGYPDLAQTRLYRTGDLVRYRPDGNLEFLGRIDQQVKVRGYRIELGEIETAIRQYDEILQDESPISQRVRDVAVIVHEETGDRRLVAFIVPDQPLRSMVQEAEEESISRASEGEILFVDHLRNFLRQLLPEYMVPSAFVILDQLPLSPSGKVDRKSLASLAVGKIGRDQLKVEYIAPRTTTEIELCKISAELLSLQWDEEHSPVGILDNFFEMGGHSLMATQFISRIRDSFKVEVPLRTLFEHPTIIELAEQIDQLKLRGTSFEAPAIRPVSREARKMKQTATGLTPSSPAQSDETTNEITQKGGQ